MKSIVITDCNHGFLDPEIESCENTDFSLTFLCLNERTPQSEVIEKCKNADIIVTQRVKINSNMASHFKRCKVIARYGVGVDNLEVDALEEMGISIVNFPRFCTEEVANHAMSLILFLYRKLNVMYNMNDFTHYWGKPGIIENIKSAPETTVGIVGLGKIGSKVEERLLACNFNVRYFDPYIDKNERATSSLEELFQVSDIVTLHCPLNDETENMINVSLFKEHLLLVNTSRGRVVNQIELEQHLKDDYSSAACIDVCDPEPASKDSYEIRNLFITPHIAFYSRQSLNNLKKDVIKKSIFRYNNLRGK